MSGQAVVQTQTIKPTFTPVASGLLQRACACGRHTGNGGECAECAKKKNSFQRKLTIGTSNDPLEGEADRVADQVLAASEHSLVSSSPPRIQRYTGQATQGTDTAPASVDRVLVNSGRPLEPALRQDMEHRFAYDFSGVRVHSGAAAEHSAREVNAHAYTVGHNIVFGAGQFAPATHEGRRLLAHELTHVIQQSCGTSELQRFVDCKNYRRPGKEMSVEDCPRRDPNEDKISSSEPSIVIYISRPDLVGFLITNFDIGESKFKESAKKPEKDWEEMIKTITQPGSEWEVLGLSDCHGTEAQNKLLRQNRADSVRAALPPSTAAHIVGSRGADLNDCFTDNQDLVARQWNRSVLITRTRGELNIPADEAEEIEGKRPFEEADTEGCAKPQKDALARAFPVAKKMVRTALYTLRDANLMRKYFGKDALAERFWIEQNFEAILRGLDGGPTFACEEDDSLWCEDAVASTWAIGDIHICQRAFPHGNDFLARTIIHEAGHRYAWIFYPDELCTGGWTGDTADAEDNADCYGEFAGDALYQAP